MAGLIHRLGKQSRVSFGKGRFAGRSGGKNLSEVVMDGPVIINNQNPWHAGSPSVLCRAGPMSPHDEIPDVQRVALQERHVSSLEPFIAVRGSTTS